SDTQFRYPEKGLRLRPLPLFRWSLAEQHHYHRHLIIFQRQVNRINSRRDGRFERRVPRIEQRIRDDNSSRRQSQRAGISRMQDDRSLSAQVNGVAIPKTIPQIAHRLWSDLSSVPAERPISSWANQTSARRAPSRPTRMPAFCSAPVALPLMTSSTI